MLSDYIPPSQIHYTYIGSLKASEEQIAKFSALYANNARPVQPLNN